MIEVWAPQPNNTKLPLQVLAVTKGNSEKIKVLDEARDRVQLYYAQNLIILISHCIFLISSQRLVWSLQQKGNFGPNLVSMALSETFLMNF